LTNPFNKKILKLNTFNLLESKMEDLTDIIKKRIKDENQIQCKEALQLAEELNLPPGKIGKALNELNIKIKGCQLGCFK
jgi:hypothetical protein